MKSVSKKKYRIALALSIIVFLAVAITAKKVAGPPEKKIFDLLSISTQEALIPGLDQGLVPQGLGYISSKDWFVISYYSDDGSPSVLSFVDASTNQPVKSVELYNTDGTAYDGHSGGVTATEQNVWVASDDHLMRRIPLSVLVNAKDGDKITFADRFMTPSVADFSFYSDGVLWCGEFYYPKAYPTDETHHFKVSGGTNYALVSGYRLDTATDSLPKGKTAKSGTPVTPDYFLSITDRIQGMSALSDGQIALSQSYGRNNNSSLLLYNNVLTEDSSTTLTVNGTEVPVWYLDEENALAKYTAPPMTEGIVQKEPGFLYVLFESGAEKYSDGKHPLYNLYKMKTD